MVAKKDARELGKRVRAGLTVEQRAMKSAMIVERCRNELAWDRIKMVHMFVPIERLNEIDTWPLLSWIWRVYPGTRTFVPRMAASEIEHVEVTSQTHFGPNAWGIPEPMTGHLLPGHKSLDLVLTPLLAFDGRGHRVGYGGGHYDRFLSRHPEALRVGLAFADCQIAEDIEVESHDMELQKILTEKAVIIPSG
ncbi:MAG TPA: 5-formyltetrahydrofolate cyclo-ligase [Candidatus Saccharimonadia bacterium]